MIVEVYLSDGSVQNVDVEEGSISHVMSQLDDLLGKDNYIHYLSV